MPYKLTIQNKSDIKYKIRRTCGGGCNVGLLRKIHDSCTSLIANIFLRFLEDYDNIKDDMIPKAPEVTRKLIVDNGVIRHLVTLGHCTVRIQDAELISYGFNLDSDLRAAIDELTTAWGDEVEIRTMREPSRGVRHRTAIEFALKK